MRLTARRRSDILEHVDLIRESWKSLPDTVTSKGAVGNEAMMFWETSWLCDKLEEMLHEHVTIAESAQPTDEAPKKSLRDRLRGLLAFGKGRQDTTS